ncbi:hypothetical protein GC169_00755 [bacterium]|nr:hypothetical protein [bacterium]
MLSAMRAFVRSKYSFVLLLLVVVGVAVTGSIDVFSVGTGGFARVGERTVSARDVNRTVDNELERIREERQEVLTRAEATERGLTASVIEDLTRRAAFLAFADQMGVRAGPKAVADFLASAPVFQSGLGGVDQSSIARFANDRGLTVDEFKQEIEDSLTFDYMRNTSVAALSPPKVLSTPLFTFFSEKRQIAVARFSPASAPIVAAPTEADLQAFYQERAAMFAQPERRSVSMINYSPEDFLDRVTVSDEQLQREYDRRKREFTDPGERVIDNFTAPDRPTLQRVVDALKQGRALEELATANPTLTIETKTVRTGDLGDATYEQLVFATPEGDAVGPMQVNGAWSGAVIRTVKAGATRELAEVAEELRESIAQREAKRLFDDSSENLYDLVGGGAPLTEIAKEVGAPVISFAAVDPNGGLEGRGRAALPASFAAGLRSMFEVDVGRYSDILEENGERTVFRLDGITPARTPTFEEVKADLTPLYMAVKTSEAAAAAAQAVATKVNAGQSLETVARNDKLLFWIPDAPVTRNDAGEVDPAILQTVFSLKSGEAGVATGQDGAPWLVQVLNIERPDEAAAPELATQVQQFIENSLAQDVFSAFVAAAVAEGKITRNQRAIDSYLAASASAPQ